MKILKVDTESIEFDTGQCIYFEHSRDCCEYNYADFKQLEQAALDYNFDRATFRIEPHPDGYGILIGDNRSRFFIPCYSSQNGYYSNKLNIYLDGELVIKNLECEIV